MWLRITETEIVLFVRPFRYIAKHRFNRGGLKRRTQQNRIACLQTCSNSRYSAPCFQQSRFARIDWAADQRFIRAKRSKRPEDSSGANTDRKVLPSFTSRPMFELS